MALPSVAASCCPKEAAAARTYVTTPRALSALVAATQPQPPKLPTLLLLPPIAHREGIGHAANQGPRIHAHQVLKNVI